MLELRGFCSKGFHGSGFHFERQRGPIIA
jgi:hypothetical protein